MPTSWGRPAAKPAEALTLRAASDPLPPVTRPVLPHGMGRSYGDSCLNARGPLLVTTRMDRMLAFDETTGVLRAESGVTLADVLRRFVPRGWFLPVTPGTKLVTLGGALANDVHGKNHHKAGTFGAHVPRFELLRSDGSRRVCSPTEDPDLYRATIGGMGLTGLVTWIELRLQRIASPMVDQETIRFADLDAFFDLSGESHASHDFSVAWVDTLARGRRLGRGIFFRGNFSSAPPARAPQAPRDERIPFPFHAPGSALNPLTVGAFNAAYWGKHVRERVATRVHYDPFFYPLDAIAGWNRLYGKRGFYQYQCVVPHADGHEALRAILEESAAARQASFLSVLKTFGDAPSPGMMSFPRPGVTFALDYPDRGARTLALLDRLDELVLDAGGAVYPAKDARMSPGTFRASFPLHDKFAALVDPAFESDLWRRVRA